MTDLPVLRGRATEIAVLTERLERAVAGRGGVIVVEGAPGQGKSRLLIEAGRLAGERGIGVGIGTATSDDRVRPFASLLAALVDPTHPLLDPGAVGDLPTQYAERYTFLREVEALLEQATLERPLLISLDDLQWSDAATVSALTTFANRLSRAPIVWLLARRANEGSLFVLDALTALIGTGASRIVLGPLAPDAVAQITADAVGATPGPALLTLAASTGGNAFLLSELLAGLVDESLIVTNGSRAELASQRLPQRVAQGMRQRLGHLSPRAREAATVAALLGRRFSFEQLMTATGVSPANLLGPAEELVREGIVIDRGGQLEFGHDLVREAVLDASPEGARHARQRALVDAQLAAGATPLSVAVALLESAQPGDEEAATILLDAARSLGASDPLSGADISAQTLELIDGSSPLRGPLIVETAQLLHAAGKVDESRAFTGDALRVGLSPVQEAEVRYVVSGMLSLSPDIRVDIGRTALELPGISDAQRARLLVRLVHSLVVGGRTDEAVALMASARTAARIVGDPTIDLTLELVHSALAYTADRFTDALEHIRTARRSAALSELARVQLSQQWLAEALTGLDEVEQADAVTDEGIEAAYRGGQIFAVRTWEAWQGRRLLQAGRLADAGAALHGLFGPDATSEHGNLAAGTALVAFGRLALHTGDEGRTRTAARLADGMFSTGTRETRRHLALLLSLQAMARHDPAAARDRLLALGADGEESLLPALAKDVHDEAHLARIARRTEDDEIGRRALLSAERRARRNPQVTTIAGTAAHVRGLLTDDADELAVAIELLGRSPRPLALASALEDRGRLLLSTSRSDEAISDLGRALELYAQAGAGWDAERARRRLRAVGVRRRLVTPMRPTTGWDALTEAEVRVAGLVARGMTNREVAAQLFISPHTVSMHLRHVYAKLVVHNRGQLMRVAREHSA